jgi:hypothetical protein
VDQGAEDDHQGVTDKNRFKVSLQELESVHVAAEDLVEEHDVAPPIPDIKAEDERLRESTLRVGAPGI